MARLAFMRLPASHDISPCGAATSEPEPEAPPQPTQAQGPGQRKCGQKLRSDERPDPLAELAKHIGAPELD